MEKNKSNNLRKVAKEYISLGLNPISIRGGTDKAPTHDNMFSEMSESQVDSHPFMNIGVCTGMVSGNLEVIDFDLYNAEDPKALMNSFKKNLPEDLLNKCVVEKTYRGGYHLMYRCEEISSSKKLSTNAEGKAVIETRGEGGYIKCYPSEGYTIVRGSLDNIPVITVSERLKLFVAAKMTSKTLLKSASKKLSLQDNQYIKKFPKYNDSEDIGKGLVEKAGWEMIGEDESWYNYTRPGTKSRDLHAGYHKEGKFFFVFSNAQDTFDTEKPYNNHALFAELECDGNYSMAYAKLFDMGYGEGSLKLKSDKKIVKEDWKVQLDDLSFLSDSVEETAYLDQVRKGEIALGKSWGWSTLDEYSRYKDNSLNFGLGFDGVGKSLLMLSMAQATNVLHGEKWGMIMPENKTGMSRRRLIECKYGVPTTYYKDKPKLFDTRLQECRENFKIISNKNHYSIKDVLEMGKRLYETCGINSLLIDPYNFFKVEGSSGYGHNNKTLSEMRVFVEKYCSLYVMAHPRSDASRTEGDSGYQKAPTKYDIQGGADFAYRVDDFFTIHRITNHPDPEFRRTMQFKMEKVKEEETGGKKHSKDEWSDLIWENRDGFLGYWDTKGNNPMYRSLKASEKVLSKVTRTMSPKEAF